MITTEDQTGAILARYEELLDEELTDEETLTKIEEIFTPADQKIISDIFGALPQPKSEKTADAPAN